MLIALILLCEEFYPFPFLFILFSFFCDSDSETMFTFAESGAISHTNTMTTLGSRSGWNSSFTTETSLERECRLEIQREHRRKRGPQESAEQRDHRLAQRRQHRQREKEEQETSIESGSISFSSQKPFTCIHDLITFYINIDIHFLLCFEDKVQL